MAGRRRKSGQYHSWQMWKGGKMTRMKEGENRKKGNIRKGIRNGRNKEQKDTDEGRRE